MFYDKIKAILILFVLISAEQSLAQNRFPVSPIAIGGAGKPAVPGPAFDAVYLRLDTTNDPLTGDLEALNIGINVVPSVIANYGVLSISGNTGGIVEFMDNGVIEAQILNDPSNGLVLQSITPLPITLITNSVERIEIDDNGVIVINETGVATADIRVEGDTDVNLLFTDASTDRVAIGTNLPTAKFQVEGTATGTGEITAYVHTAVTGIGTTQMFGENVLMDGAFTGAATTTAISGRNDLAGTNTDYAANIFGWRPSGNRAVVAHVIGTTVASNVGSTGTAANGNANYGAWGAATIPKAGAINIGSTGVALNSGGGGAINIAGFFGLGDGGGGALANSVNTDFSLLSAAIFVSNGTTTDPIALFRDNVTTIFTIADGGNSTFTQNLTTDGNLTAGNSTSADLATINGRLIQTHTPAINAGTISAYTLNMTVPANSSGVNIQTALNIPITISNSTAGTNTAFGVFIDTIGTDAQQSVYGIFVDDITGTAAVENAIYVEGGWDTGFSSESPIFITYSPAVNNGVDNVSRFDLIAPADSSGVNTHTVVKITTTIGNATAGTNDVIGAYIDMALGDAQVARTGIFIGSITATAAAELAINIGSNWDEGIRSDSIINIKASGNQFGSTTANAFTSNVTATAGVDTFYQWNATVTNNLDSHTAWCAGGSCAMIYRQTNGSTASAILEFGGIGSIQLVSGIIALQNTVSKTGPQITFTADADAAGEYIVNIQANDNLSGAGLDTILLSLSEDSGTAIKLQINAAGHIISTGETPTFTTGTCGASESGTGDDLAFTVTGNCNSTETLIVVFGRQYANAPICTLVPMSSTARTGAVTYTTSTTAVTVTVNTNMGGIGTFAATCIE